MEEKYFYNVTVQYEVVVGEDKTKKVKEIYLVSAVNPTDADVVVAKDMEGSGLEYRIIKIEESKITKIL
jgi:hypothetical protein